MVPSTSSRTCFSNDGATIPIRHHRRPLGTPKLIRRPQEKWGPILSPTDREEIYNSPLIQDIIKSWAIRKGETDHVPRPPNCFMVFRKMTNLSSSIWNALSLEQKKPWQDISEWCKNEHKKQFSGYKYQPKPKTICRRAKKTERMKKQAVVPPPSLHPEGPSTSTSQACPRQFNAPQELLAADNTFADWHCYLQSMGLPSISYTDPSISMAPVSSVLPLEHGCQNQEIFNPFCLPTGCEASLSEWGTYWTKMFTQYG